MPLLPKMSMPQSSRKCGYVSLRDKRNFAVVNQVKHLEMVRLPGCLGGPSLITWVLIIGRQKDQSQEKVMQ